MKVYLVLAALNDQDEHQCMSVQDGFLDPELAETFRETFGPMFTTRVRPIDVHDWKTG